MSTQTAAVQFTQIATHQNPDIDEVLGAAMLRIFGESFFPGIGSAELVYVDPESVGADGQMAEVLGQVMVGVGHGRFDEHPKPGEPNAKEGESAATLVAKYLGVYGLPALAKLLDFTVKNDLKGVGSTWDVGVVPKVMFQSLSHDIVVKWLEMAVWAIYTEEESSSKSGKPYNAEDGVQMWRRILAMWLRNNFGSTKLPLDEVADFVFAGEPDENVVSKTAEELGVSKTPALQPLLKLAASKPHDGDLFTIRGVPELILNYTNASEEETLEWAYMAIDAMYQDQVNFLGPTAEEFKAKARMLEIRRGKETLKVAVVDKCDNRQINKYARSKHGGYCALVIQRNSDGHVQLLPNKHDGLDLQDLAAMLRLEELRANGEVNTSSWDELRSEGMLAGWYYHHEGQLLLNGSIKAKDVPVSRLSLERIEELVHIALAPRLFEESRYQKCKNGICTSRRSDPCPWHEWGLDRCRQVRLVK